MARTKAKFLTLMLLVLSGFSPCLAAQDLESVFIGGFAWNLTDSKSTVLPDSDGNLYWNVVAWPQRLLQQTAKLQFHYVALVRQRMSQTATENCNGQSDFECQPIYLLNATCPHECCFVVEQSRLNDFTTDEKGEVEIKASHSSCRLSVVDLPKVAHQLVSTASQKMIPMVKSMAEGAFRTASWTSQHSRFPIHSANPLRLRDVNSVVNRQHAVGTHLKPNESSPQQMDAYWHYYSDCDRWNVVFAELTINPQTAKHSLHSLGFKKSHFVRAGRAIFEATSINEWLAICDRFRGRFDLLSIADQWVVAWRGLEFRAIESTFARAMVESANAGFAPEFDESMQAE